MSSFKKRFSGAQRRLRTDDTDVHQQQQQQNDESRAIPPGVRVSPYNSTLLLSTGIPSLDDVLGGGVPAGSILLIEEDTDTSYAKLLLRYWIAQGLASQHDVAVISSGLDMSPQAILAKLPFAEDDTDDANDAGSSTSATVAMPLEEPLANDDEEDTPSNDTNTGPSTSALPQSSMKIAFRYEGMKKYETSVADVNALLSAASAVPFCSRFDLTKVMSTASEARQKRVHVCDIIDSPEAPYETALARIKQVLR